MEEAIGSGVQSSSSVGMALELVPQVVFADELWKVAPLGRIMRFFIKSPRKIQTYHDGGSLLHKCHVCDWRCAFLLGTCVNGLVVSELLLGKKYIRILKRRLV
jgi:hypothetical protein